MLNKMGIGISSEKGGHLFCEQCGQTFPIRAKYRDVTRHLGSHEPIYGELQDCIVCHCDVEECPNYTLNNFFDLRETNGQFYFNIHQHNIPMCEHMWANAKNLVDESLADRKEEVTERGITKWCPHCLRRVPKSCETCPECGGKLDKVETGMVGKSYKRDSGRKT